MAAVGMNVEEVEQAAQDVANTKMEMDQSQNAVRNIVDGLIAAWEGKASEKFQEVMEVFDEKAKVILERLDEIGSLIGDSAYNAAEADVAGQDAVSPYLDEL
ncbi:WXG100 family type VII secretion target [Salininema proteolyticum]|uniref:ESAT-6-like protein n=1 Tax=Salininema proteolyticum TaxID=1607685 RepID=A0ABV8TWB1_9ACTN